MMIDGDGGNDDLSTVKTMEFSLSPVSMLFTSTGTIRLIRAYGQCPACFKGSLGDDQDCRAQELSESRGGRPLVSVDVKQH